MRNVFSHERFDESSRNALELISALLFLGDIFRGTISFLETLVNISVKATAGELAGPANWNRAGLHSFEKLFPGYSRKGRSKKDD